MLIKPHLGKIFPSQGPACQQRNDQSVTVGE
jgi:hypothetical protein